MSDSYLIDKDTVLSCFHIGDVALDFFFISIKDWSSDQ